MWNHNAEEEKRQKMADLLTPKPQLQRLEKSVPLILLFPAERKL